MRLTVPAAAALAATMLASACAGGGSLAAPRSAPPASTAASTATGGAGTDPATTTTAPTSTAPTATATPTARDDSTLTLAFGGDVHFEEYLAPLARDPRGLAELEATLGAADLSVVNLETAITERGAVIGKEFHFRAPASALDTLAGADYGSVGLADTLAARAQSPIPIVGIGADQDDAFAPATLEAKGVRVALLGASQVYEMTLANWSADADSPGIASAAPVTRLRAAVTKAAATHDLVVVFMHWGFDYQLCPDAQSAQTARALEAAGADIIVGGHSHRVNGAGWLGRSYVAYGLGNFVWWRSREPDARTGVLTLTVDADAARAATASTTPLVREADWTPMLIGTDGIPRVPGATDTARLTRVWEQAAACSGLAVAP